MSYIKLKTIPVKVGDLVIGGEYPIRIQSMTTADTMNTQGVVEECIRLIDAGCELIRITAPSLREAENLLNIKKELNKRGYKVPLCADIHYTPNAAEVAARIVEKVRINPGNYADKKKFELKEYTDAEYNAELERIRDKFVPLIRVCKEYGTALRIGTNHGSLSDRILSRYGDTPRGMVESALEFVRICEDESFYNIVISMKASNPLVMIDSYRLLVAEMIKRNTLYPLHLGVTEAGDGEDGRIKSAIGIGTLLEDGIGDTIRVSLTEPAENEIPAAIKLVEGYNQFLTQNGTTKETWLLTNHTKWTAFTLISEQSYTKNYSHFKHSTPIVIQSVHQNPTKPSHFYSCGYIYNLSTDKWTITDFAVDYIYIGDNSIDFDLPGNVGIIQNFARWKLDKKPQCYPLFSYQEYISSSEFSTQLNFIEIADNEIRLLTKSEKLNDIPAVLIISVSNEFYSAGNLKEILKNNVNEWNIPVVFKLVISTEDTEKFVLDASRIMGVLMTEGLGYGIMIVKDDKIKSFAHQSVNKLMFNILQGLRQRISKTEYIACPSCGRTLFDLQETTKKIKEKTAHLKGLKIGIMGCIVNGPGEMADADFGYVGTGPGKISLYKGHQVVKRNIPEERAVEELISLIKEYGLYTEPSENTDTKYE